MKGVALSEGAWGVEGGDDGSVEDPGEGVELSVVCGVWCVVCGVWCGVGVSPNAGSRSVKGRGKHPDDR